MNPAVATSAIRNATKVGSRMFLGLASQFSKPTSGALTRTPPSSLLPLSKAYNSLSLLQPSSAATVSSSLNTRRRESVAPRRNITGAGVVLFDKNTDSVILFENASRNCYEEPGGFLKPNYDPASSACLELFEESCTLISKNKSSFLPDFVDVSGRSRSTMYRGFFMNVDKPPSHKQFLQKRSQLEQEGYPSDFLETKGMVFIPIPHLAASLAKPIDWDGDHHAPVGVKDIYGVEIPVSKRTLKIFREGGLKIIGQVPASASSNAEGAEGSSGKARIDQAV